MSEDKKKDFEEVVKIYATLPERYQDRLLWYLQGLAHGMERK